MSYDQWKTASPYDDVVDCQCGGPIDENGICVDCGRDHTYTLDDYLADRADDAYSEGFRAIPRR